MTPEVWIDLRCDCGHRHARREDRNLGKQTTGQACHSEADEGRRAEEGTGRGLPERDADAELLEALAGANGSRSAMTARLAFGLEEARSLMPTMATRATGSAYKPDGRPAGRQAVSTWQGLRRLLATDLARSRSS
jgi:hypothetical protein